MFVLKLQGWRRKKEKEKEKTVRLTSGKFKEICLLNIW